MKAMGLFEYTQNFDSIAFIFVLNHVLIMSTFMSFLICVLTMHKMFSIDGAMHPKNFSESAIGC